MVWTPGTRLHGDKYTIEKILGQGRFGITYLAKDNKGDRVVIKTLQDTYRQLPQFDQWQEKFNVEAFKLYQYKHPHIVRVLEPPFLADGLRCLALEYIPGITLADAQLPLDETQALKYIQQIGSALTVVHEKKLVHRDVKPANIMIKAGSTDTVLIDFGLARDFDYKKLSVSAMTVAEPGYTPPELYSQTVEIGAYTDVYSLAATLYNLLTAQLPTPADKRKQGIPLKAPKELNPQTSDKVSREIMWAMELEPTRRPQSVKQWLDSLGLEELTNESPDDTSDAKRQKKLAETQTLYGKLSFWAAIAGLLLAVIAIFTGIFQDDIKQIFSQPSPPPSSQPNKPHN
jgi:serine/threonine protein kinase